MKYFEYLVLFLIIWALPIFYWHQLIRFKHLKKMAKINILKRQQKLQSRTFYASYIVEQCVIKLWFMPFKQAQKALADLCGGRVTSAVSVLKKNYPDLSLLLLAHSLPEHAYRQIYKQRKKWLKNKEYGVFLPLLAHILFKPQTFSDLIGKINVKNIKKSVLPYYQYAMAFAYL